MSESLPELRRQRALLQQHLDRLDAAIAAATPMEPAPPPAEPAPDSAEAEALNRARAEADEAPAKARLGCWIAFAGSFAVLALLMAIWFVARYGWTLSPAP